MSHLLIENVDPLFKIAKNSKTTAIYSGIRSSESNNYNFKSYIIKPKPNLLYPSYEKDFKIYLSENIITYHEKIKSHIALYFDNIKNKLLRKDINESLIKEYDNIIKTWEESAYTSYPSLKSLLENNDCTYNLQYGNDMTIQINKLFTNIYQSKVDYKDYYEQFKKDKKNMNYSEIFISIESLNNIIEKACENEETINKFIKNNKEKNYYYVEEYFDYRKDYMEQRKDASRKLKKDKEDEMKLYSEFYVSNMLQQDNHREIIVNLIPSSIKLATTKDGKKKLCIIYMARSITVFPNHIIHNIEGNLEIDTIESDLSYSSTGDKNNEIYKLIDMLYNHSEESKTELNNMLLKLKELFIDNQLAQM